MFKSVVIFLVFLAPADSQVLSFGLKAGVSVTDAYNSGQVADGGESHSNDRYILGPTAEIHFPLHLSIEADALYRHSSFSVTGGGISGIPNGNFPVNDWQFPVLAKFDILLGAAIARPFADAGIVYRHVSGNNSFPPAHANGAGIALGAGITIKVAHFRLEPEIRYTHWGQEAFVSVPSTSNQADLLVGFTF